MVEQEPMDLGPLEDSGAINGPDAGDDDDEGQYDMNGGGNYGGHGVRMKEGGNAKMLEDHANNGMEMDITTHGMVKMIRSENDDNMLVEGAQSQPQVQFNITFLNLNPKETKRRHLE